MYKYLLSCIYTYFLFIVQLWPLQTQCLHPWEKYIVQCFCLDWQAKNKSQLCLQRSGFSQGSILGLVLFTMLTNHEQFRVTVWDSTILFINLKSSKVTSPYGGSGIQLVNGVQCKHLKWVTLVGNNSKRIGSNDGSSYLENRSWDIMDILMEVSTQMCSWYEKNDRVWICSAMQKGHNVWHSLA